MKNLILIIFLLNLNFAFGNQECVRTIKFGKICHQLYGFNINTEHAFKQEAIAKLTEIYLRKLLTKKDYNSLREIKLDINYSNNDSVSLRTTLSGISCEIHGISGLASKTLKVIDYILRDIDNDKIDVASIQTRINTTSIYSSLSAYELNMIYSRPLNRIMRECLNIPFYRHFDNKFPNTQSSSNNLYTFKNDTFFINNKKHNLIKLQDISYILVTKRLGCLYFDTDSSFIHFNRYDLFNYKKPPKISKHHYITDNVYNRKLILEEEDILNNRILIYYNSQPPDLTDSIGCYPKYVFGMKRKFMYLIDQDYLIPDYQKLEQYIIEEYLINNKR